MKIAVLVVGALRTFLSHHMNLWIRFNELNVDFFFCTSNGGNSSLDNSKGMRYKDYDSVKVAEIITTIYKPIVFADVTTPFIENTCNVGPLSQRKFDHSQQYTIQRMWETLAATQKCFEFMEHHEYESHLMYDFVLRLRPDIIFYGPIITTSFKAQPSFPAGRVLCNIKRKCLNDHIAILPRYAAARYFRLAEEYLWCQSNLTWLKYNRHFYIAELLYIKFEDDYLIDPSLHYTLVRPNELECTRVPKSEFKMCAEFARNMSMKTS